MFEVGKKYINDEWQTVVECVHVSSSENGLVYVTMKYADGSVDTRVDKTTGVATDWSRYSEYKEPIKLVRYFNVYKNHIGPSHFSRGIADGQAGFRIGCVRVEFTEGQYDE